MLQAEKAGLMELADLLLVNKSDLERAEEKAEQLNLALELSNNQVPPILMVSAKQKTGFEDLFFEMEKISKSEKVHVMKSRISLSFAWENLLWNHKDISTVLEKLELGELTIDEAITYLKKEI